MTEFTAEEARHLVILASLYDAEEFVDQEIRATIYKAKSIVTYVTETHRAVEAFRVISDM